MAQLNITLNQEEILQLLSNDRNEVFRKLLESSLNSVLKAESQEQLKAHPYERTLDRTDSRNGSRERKLQTRIGTITLNVPRHRNQPFKTMLFDNYSRSEAALISTMSEMVVHGVSTRKVSQIVETLCGTSVSKSAVSEVCKDLSREVEDFRNRLLTGPYPFLTIDATYFKVRENHRVISKALMIAYGTNAQGHREVLGFETYPCESADTWTQFLAGLKKRGLTGLLMITSDAHEGILHGISKIFPAVPWQRCQVHFNRNITDKAPKAYQAGLRSELFEMFSSKTIEEARKKRDEIINDYKEIAEKAMECLDEGFENAMTAMIMPGRIRQACRTTNHLERLNRELKRRSKVIGIFPNVDSIIRLMGSLLIEHSNVQQSRTAMFSKETYKNLIQSDIPENLVRIAEEQKALLAA